MSHVNGIKISREYMLSAAAHAVRDRRRGTSTVAGDSCNTQASVAEDRNDEGKDMKEDSASGPSQAYRRAIRITRMLQ